MADVDTNVVLISLGMMISVTGLLLYFFIGESVVNGGVALGVQIVGFAIVLFFGRNAVST